MNYIGSTKKNRRSRMGPLIGRTERLTAPAAAVGVAAGLLLAFVGPAKAVAGYSAVGSGLALRSAPSTTAAVITRFANGQPLDIACQTTGTVVIGSAIWDKISGTQGYVSDYFVNGTPYAAFDSRLPRCGTAVQPASSSATGSLATTSGAACVFLAPNSIAWGIGHVGWGFELPNGSWAYGANDGAPWGTPSNTVRQPPGSKAAMLNYFAKANSGSNAYTEYKCATVRAPNASAAQQEVNREYREKYYIPTQDCVSQAYKVLSQYGVKNMPSFLVDWVPTNWFGWLMLAGFPANPTSL